jgi:SAM-dependent methyltransferase
MRDDHHNHHGAGHDTADADLVEMLDLDGEVLRSYWTDVLTWVQHEGAGAEHVLDLGAGSGVGTIALAQRFDGAEVVAVDVSPEMLRHIHDKALHLGLAPRIRTVEADLDVGWPAVGPVDVTWASMSLHHLADPDRVLRDVFTATRPGGLIAVAEMSEPLRFLPDDVGFGRPGLEGRCLDILGKEHAHSVPELGSDWSPRLAAAGFTLLSERTLTVAVNPPYPPGAIRYAELWLRRLRSAAADQLDRDDLETLAVLLGGDGAESLQQRGNLHIRGCRTVTLARRSS